MCGTKEGRKTGREEGRKKRKKLKKEHISKVEVMMEKFYVGLIRIKIFY